MVNESENRLRPRYCMKCKTRQAINKKCGCNVEVLNTYQIIEKYHQNTNSVLQTKRILNNEGFNFAKNTIFTTIKIHPNLTIPTASTNEKREELERLKKAREDFQELEIITRQLHHYISQKCNPVFPIPIEFVMIEPLVRRHKTELEQKIRVSLP